MNPTETPSLHEDENQYLLDRRILFSEMQSTLSDERRNLEIKLQRPASRCLALLIQHQGELVPQNDLITYAWEGERARYIAPNTFYQTMHHLRDALGKAGLEDAIYTVPRKGSGLNPTLSAISSPASGSRSSLKRDRKFLTFRATGFLTGGVVVLSLILLIIISSHYSGTPLKWLTIRNNNSIFSHFPLRIQQKCRIYVSPGSLSDNKVDFLLQRAGIDCLEDMTIFISASVQGNRKSLISCSTYTKRKQQCQVFFIMDDFNV